MGARVARMFRNFNLENRAHREISKAKPVAAPRHAAKAPDSTGGGGSEAAETVNKKNEPLLSLLKSVYVESTDPGTAAAATTAAAEAPKEVTVGREERRPLKFSVPLSAYGLAELTDVPKGKLTISEALKATSSHQQQPQTWTPEKIAQDYCLDLKDTQALLEFFIPFQVHIKPPKTENVKQIKSS